MIGFLKNYGWLFGNLIWINMLLSILLIFFERRNPTVTLLWIMVLVFLPGIGFVFYLFLGQDLSKKRIFKVKERADTYYKDLITEQKVNLNSGIYHQNDRDFDRYRDLVELHLRNSQAYYTHNNDVEIYYNGQEKFAALLESIKNAKEYIYIQYYIFKDDEIGSEIIEELIKKSEEGLEVKFLVDGMGGRNLSRESRKKMEDAGIDLAVFFPPFVPFISVRINYRNHRKLCVIDGREGYVGGFNVGDEYLGRYKKFGHWRDTHIKIVGSAVNSLQWRFFLDWKFASNSEIETKQSYLHEKNSEEKVGIQIVSSGPDSKWPSVKDGYMKMISDAREKLYIESPYFIPDDSMLEALRLASLSGVDVRVMLPNKPDHIFVYWAGMSYVGDLLKAGVRFYTYEEGFLHSKVFISDDYVSSVGTANLDIRSFQLNFEVNAFMYDKEINRQLTENFIKDLEYCEEITPEKYEKRSIIIKIKESFSRLLSPIL